MCIAIYKPAGAWLAKRALRECFRRNPDGAGYAWHDGERVQMVKGFFSWRSFWKSMRKHVTTDTPAFLHFRISTRGKRDVNNCHPFALDNGVLMHNGPCLNYKACNGDDERSDTAQFAEDFINGLESWQFERIRPMIEDFAGTEKILAMFDDGAVVICNENQGHWANGCWWSNHSYVTSVARSLSTTVATTPGKHYRPRGYANYDGNTVDMDEYEGEPDPFNLYGVSHNNVVPLVDCSRDIWSVNLRTHVQRQVKIVGTIHKWCESAMAYVQQDLTQEYKEHDGMIYDSNDNGATYVPVGYVIDSVEDYLDFIRLYQDQIILPGSKEDLARLDGPESTAADKAAPAATA